MAGEIKNGRSKGRGGVKVGEKRGEGGVKDKRVCARNENRDIKERNGKEIIDV